MAHEPILLTPGPLTTSLRTRLAMLKDWGSWDSDFIAATARLREQLLAILHADDSHVLVPLQGSGTFSVEAAVATLVPRDGHVLVLENGAYGQRAARLTHLMGRRCSLLSFPEDSAVDALALAARLQQDSTITHVLLVHCETSAGILNPLDEVAEVCERSGRGLIVDAISAFGALEIDARRSRFDALVAASGKCLEGVPGMGFVFIRKAVLDACAGRSQSLAMDLHDQHVYMQRTGQWRFTPPTHVMAALLEALAQFEEEGGRTARLARYRANCAVLLEGMRGLGFAPFLPARIQAPIIVTFDAPDHPAYDFKRFYAAVKARGFLLYPGKLTQRETFRVGCIGAIDGRDMEQAVHAVRLAMRELGMA